MYKTLKARYDCSYRPLAMEKAVQEISDAHRQLISHLDKADRKLVLQIIDAKDSIINASSLDGFICGFQWYPPSQKFGDYSVGIEIYAGL